MLLVLLVPVALAALFNIYCFFLYPNKILYSAMLFYVVTIAIAAVAFFMRKTLLTGVLLALMFMVTALYGLFMFIIGLKSAIIRKEESVVFPDATKELKIVTQENRTTGETKQEEKPPEVGKPYNLTDFLYNYNYMYPNYMRNTVHEGRYDDTKQNLSCNANIPNSGRGPKTEVEKEIVRHSIEFIDSIVTYIRGNYMDNFRLKAVASLWKKNVYITDLDILSYNCKGDIYLNPSKDIVSFGDEEMLNTLLLIELARCVNMAGTASVGGSHTYDLLWQSTFLSLLNIATEELEIPCAISCSICQKYGICYKDMCDTCKWYGSSECPKPYYTERYAA